MTQHKSLEPGFMARDIIQSGKMKRVGRYTGENVAEIVNRQLATYQRAGLKIRYDDSSEEYAIFSQGNGPINKPTNLVRVTLIPKDQLEILVSDLVEANTLGELLIIKAEKGYEVYSEARD